MLLYISGSYPDNKEGIAAGAKVLLDAMVNVCGKEKIVLLTTNTPIITDNININSLTSYELLDDWRLNVKNIKRFYDILDKYPIKAIHMEYPGDLYGKTFLASFIPYLVQKYNKKNKTYITCNVRLHEFSRARFLRKLAIIPILMFASSIYVPALKDRNIIRKYSGRRVLPTIIGTNIKVVSDEFVYSDKKIISYFGSVYPGKGIERMLRIWKSLKEQDSKSMLKFKIIGDVGTERTNHFSDYHRQVWKWIEQNGLKDDVEVTGYLSDEEVSEEIRNSSVAVLPYEDGLTLRRGSFLAYLAHGVPIVTTLGDDEANSLFLNHPGVSMVDSDSDFVDAVKKYVGMTKKELQDIHTDNKQLSLHFNWNKIAETFLRDYKII